MKNNTFLSSALQAIPRLLSCIDANPYSKTYGCIDRDFWHYKTVTDFPCATYQQGILTLAYLYKKRFEGNIYFQQTHILSLIEAGIRFWCSIQHEDGTFDEWYYNEHSHVATAFTSYAFSEIYILLQENLSSEVLQQLHTALQKSGKFLSFYLDTTVTNHTAGAISALFNIFNITKDNYFLDGLKKNISAIEKNQDPEEGWFFEYGGADAGYVSVSVDYLAKYWIVSRDEKIFPILKKALHFLTYCIHPDGSFGGVYGSRNTSYVLPHGIFLLAPHFQEAQLLSKKIYSAFQSYSQNYLITFDNRYLIFFFLSNWLQTGFTYTEASIQPPFDAEEYFEKHLPNAGFFVKRTPSYLAIVNYKKNGVMKIFSSSDHKLVYSDTGYFASLSNGTIAYSGEYDSRRAISFSNVSLNITGYFTEFKNDLPLTKYLIPFHIWNKTLGNISSFSHWLHALIKKIKITKKKNTHISLTRQITFLDTTILISDTIQNKSHDMILSISLTNSLSGLHVPSSKFITTPSDFLFDITEFNRIKKIGSREMCNNITLHFHPKI